MEARKITETYGKSVYTEDGYLFGRVQDVVLGKYSVYGWVITVPPESALKKSIPTVKAVIIPHKAVKAVGDILIVSSKLELPTPPNPQGEATMEEAL